MTKIYNIDERIPSINRIGKVQEAIDRFGIMCSTCRELWMVGDRDRTKEEKDKWMCPNCKRAIAKDSMIETLAEQSERIKQETAYEERVH